jgi:hypothetical protein
MEVDLSAGAVALSSRVHGHDRQTSMTSFLDTNASLLQELSPQQTPPPAVLYLQMGKRAVKKIPDGALLGLLVVISTELLQREVSTKSPLLPPLVRELANSTLGELDQKLEVLSRLEWRVDPFIQSELGNLRMQPMGALERYVSSEVLPWVESEGTILLSKFLNDRDQVRVLVQSAQEIIRLLLLSLQKNPSEGFPRQEWDRVVETIGSTLLNTIRSQPIEAIDRFMLNDVLPQIDNQLSPILSNLIADPAQVNVVVNNIKDLVKQGADALKVDNVVGGAETRGAMEKRKAKITDRILEQVDSIGRITEEAVNEWNRIVGDFGKSVKINTVRDLLPNRVYSAWRKTREGSLSTTTKRNAILDTVSSTSDDSSNDATKSSIIESRNSDSQL